MSRPPVDKIPFNKPPLSMTMLFHLLKKMSPDHHWHLKLRDLLKKHPQIALRVLGLDDNWHTDPFWMFNSGETQ